MDCKSVDFNIYQGFNIIAYVCLGSSVVERFHGKEEVEGSIPSPGSKSSFFLALFAFAHKVKEEVEGSIPSPGSRDQLSPCYLGVILVHVCIGV